MPETLKMLVGPSPDKLKVLESLEAHSKNMKLGGLFSKGLVDDTKLPLEHHNQHSIVIYGSCSGILLWYSQPDKTPSIWYLLEKDIYPIASDFYYAYHSGKLYSHSHLGDRIVEILKIFSTVLIPILDEQGKHVSRNMIYDFIGLYNTMKAITYTECKDVLNKYFPLEYLSAEQKIIMGCIGNINSGKPILLLKVRQQFVAYERKSLILLYDRQRIELLYDANYTTDAYKNREMCKILLNNSLQIPLHNQYSYIPTAINATEIINAYN